jgi:hypothetical protein
MGAIVVFAIGICSFIGLLGAILQGNVQDAVICSLFLLSVIVPVGASLWVKARSVAK